eukprot:1176533-Rhodomonas_salina.1
MDRRSERDHYILQPSNASSGSDIFLQVYRSWNLGIRAAGLAEHRIAFSVKLGIGDREPKWKILVLILLPQHSGWGQQSQSWYHSSVERESSKCWRERKRVVDTAEALKLFTGTQQLKGEGSSGGDTVASPTKMARSSVSTTTKCSFL